MSKGLQIVIGLCAVILTATIFYTLIVKPREADQRERLCIQKLAETKSLGDATNLRLLLELCRRNSIP